MWVKHCEHWNVAVRIRTSWSSILPISKISRLVPYCKSLIMLWEFVSSLSLSTCFLTSSMYFLSLYTFFLCNTVDTKINFWRLYDLFFVCYWFLSAVRAGSLLFFFNPASSITWSHRFPAAVAAAVEPTCLWELFSVQALVSGSFATRLDHRNHQ